MLISNSRICTLVSTANKFIHRSKKINKNIDHKSAMDITSSQLFKETLLGKQILIDLFIKPVHAHAFWIFIS